MFVITLLLIAILFGVVGLILLVGLGIIAMICQE